MARKSAAIFLLLSFLILLFGLLLPNSKSGVKSLFSYLLNPVRNVLNKPEPVKSARNRREFVRVPILLYHYIEDVTDERDFLRRGMATRPYFFDLQMKYLANKGYTTISLSDLKGYLEGETNPPEKPIVVTFDDGFRDYYYNAFPILKKYNLHAVVFMIVNHIGRSGNLTEEMTREMVDSKVFELGSHTLNHVWLSKVGRDEARREIFDSKTTLEKMFGVPIKHFAYPGGFEDEELTNMAKEAGYETASGTHSGVIQTWDKVYSLKRLRVGNLGETEFADLINRAE